MEKKEVKFKTNLSCGGCISKVRNDLDNHPGIASWNVDISSPDKILTVQSEGASDEEVIEIIKSKGFKADLMK
ncbi:MAG: heavy-metal-associated domain-containing protein [Bacteroidia bacterium]|jgi:copper chaperone CopZ|nr:heavy-metal-associated domain-containing protein [Bacteroidia bacterium]